MIDVIMPKMGESIIEGTILEWKKNIGDDVVKDETILEISTDKVDSDVPAPASGVLVEIIAKVNDAVPVGEVIARIGEEEEQSISLEDEQNVLSDEKENLSVEPEEKMESEVIESKKGVQVENTFSNMTKRFYSPLVKSIAKNENVSLKELDSMPGSGLNGRVNKLDILSYIEHRGVSGSDVDINGSKLSDQSKMVDRVEPMSRMRKKIADHMIRSVQVSPHVYTTVEADVTNLVKLRSEYKDDFQNRSGLTLTYTPMIIDACIRTIQEFPLINASLDGDNIIHHGNINMGVAVALPDDNLIVPVIQESEEKNFLGLARSTTELAARARKNDLSPDEIFGSTFTVTNPGVFGGLFGMGIINQPNVGILAVGSFQKRPVVKETEFGDAVVIRSMVYLTLSYDHRIIDGAYGTRFLSYLVEQLENYDVRRIKG